MKNFLKGKRMWGYVGGTFVVPQDEKNAKSTQKMETWEVNNSKITTQINNYVLQTIGMQVEKYDLAKAIWDHLKMLNVQSNFAKQYQLKIDIRALKQSNMSIQEFYSTMSNLWDRVGS